VVMNVLILMIVVLVSSAAARHAPSVDHEERQIAGRRRRGESCA
jgi:hypothetical protein